MLFNRRLDIVILEELNQYSDSETKQKPIIHIFKVHGKEQTIEMLCRLHEDGMIEYVAPVYDGDMCTGIIARIHPKGRDYYRNDRKLRRTEVIAWTGLAIAILSILVKLSSG